MCLCAVEPVLKDHSKMCFFKTRGLWWQVQLYIRNVCSSARNVCCIILQGMWSLKMANRKNTQYSETWLEGPLL